MLISLRFSQGSKVTNKLFTRIPSEGDSVLPTVLVWRNLTAVRPNIGPSTTTIKQWTTPTMNNTSAQTPVTTEMVTITKLLATSGARKPNCTTTLLWQPQRIAGKTTTVYRTTTTITKQINCKGCILVTETLPYTVPVGDHFINASPANPKPPGA